VAGLSLAFGSIAAISLDLPLPSAGTDLLRRAAARATRALRRGALAPGCG